MIYLSIYPKQPGACLYTLYTVNKTPGFRPSFLDQDPLVRPEVSESGTPKLSWKSGGTQTMYVCVYNIYIHISK